jgi:hypothetical protein
VMHWALRHCPTCYTACFDFERYNFTMGDE